MSTVIFFTDGASVVSEDWIGDLTKTWEKTLTPQSSPLTFTAIVRLDNGAPRVMVIRGDLVKCLREG